jgi:predicted RNase H-like nuclease
MTATTFLGVNLAWKTEGNHSGIAILEGDERQVQLSTLAEGIVSMAGASSVLIVKNATGQRPCETLISKHFGRYDAGCHTSNTAKQHSDTGMKLV